MRLTSNFDVSRMEPVLDGGLCNAEAGKSACAADNVPEPD